MSLKYLKLILNIKQHDMTVRRRRITLTEGSSGWLEKYTEEAIQVRIPSTGKNNHNHGTKF